jgi:hypothetical protein
MAEEVKDEGRGGGEGKSEEVREGMVVGEGELEEAKGDGRVGGEGKSGAEVEGEGSVGGEGKSGVMVKDEGSVGGEGKSVANTPPLPRSRLLLGAEKGLTSVLKRA